jgi:hypothetical protein
MDIQAAEESDDIVRIRSPIKIRLRHRDIFGEQGMEEPFSGTKSPQKSR